MSDSRRGIGSDAQGIVASAPEDSAAKIGQCIVAINVPYFRPAEVDTLLGDPSKAREKLGGVARTTFGELIAEMMAADLSIARRDTLISNAGYRAKNHHE